jgi:transcriptional regulator with XRE-family HTH domain
MAHLFGQKLRHLREQHGLTQVELAQRLHNTSQAHLSNLETGRFAPSLDLIALLANTFDVTSDYLLRDNVPVQAANDHIATSAGRAELSAAAFSARLHALRRQANLTQEQLARELGLAAHAHISLLERGHKSPSLALVVQIANVLEVKTDMLLSMEDRESAS